MTAPIATQENPADGDATKKSNTILRCGCGIVFDNIDHWEDHRGKLFVDEDGELQNSTSMKEDPPSDCVPTGNDKNTNDEETTPTESKENRPPEVRQPKPKGNRNRSIVFSWRRRKAMDTIQEEKNAENNKKCVEDAISTIDEQPGSHNKTAESRDDQRSEETNKSTDTNGNENTHKSTTTANRCFNAILCRESLTETHVC